MPLLGCPLWVIGNAEQVIICKRDPISGTLKLFWSVKMGEGLV